MEAWNKPPTSTWYYMRYGDEQKEKGPRPIYAIIVLPKSRKKREFTEPSPTSSTSFQQKEFWMKRIDKSTEKGREKQKGELEKKKEETARKICCEIRERKKKGENKKGKRRRKTQREQEEDLMML